ncbi:DUF4167 domain-containing protein [Alphaproteobacteria bacterium GH1-50]|uniref:DUF4167 domain-containing protein n=1 Tax=Kangsaoukella pontilimi TaxID=2691042 RepID=A0A7C9IFG4_9RHOB|nr:DUF4167 domain-containing protein [Kangsaoukella pontilimi]MXQ07544.1 DUF4167 domain-containing protein [Kangsaoukella pontilimi]
MRSSKSRSRNKNNRNRSVGNIVNRVFDSSGPEGKVRGTPQQIIDKYNQLARDAQLANDRVATENFQQHAEHYLRMLSEAQREQQERQQQQQSQNDGRQQRRDDDDDDQDNQSSQNNQQSEGRQRDQGGDGNDNGGNNDAGGGNGGNNGSGSNRRGKRRNDNRSDDVIDFEEKAESGLVETPEERPKKTRRPRKKAEDAEPSSEAPAPDAAE